MNSKIKKLTGLFISALLLVILLPNDSILAKTKNTKKSMTVTNQKELKKALKNKNLTKLNIKTNKFLRFEIPSGYYDKLSLKVDAPNSGFNCWGKWFKNLDITANSWVQNMDVKKIKLHNSTDFTLTENIKVDDITVVGESNKAAYNIKGSVKKLTIKAKSTGTKIKGSIFTGEGENGDAVLRGMDVTNISRLDINEAGDFDISELTADSINANKPVSLTIANTSKIANLNINSGGSGSSVNTDSALTANIYGGSKLTIRLGAEGTIVNIKEIGAITEISNLASKAVLVNTPNGYVRIDNNTSMTVNPATDGIQNSSHDKNTLPPG